MRREPSCGTRGCDRRGSSSPAAAPASSSSRVRPPPRRAPPLPSRPQRRGGTRPGAALPSSQSAPGEAEWTVALGQWRKGSRAEGLADSPRECPFLIGHKPPERQAVWPTIRGRTAPERRAGASCRKERGALLGSPRFHWSALEGGL